MSAIADSSDGPTPIIQVLFALFPNMDTLDFTGPLEVFSSAKHNISDAGKPCSRFTPLNCNRSHR